MTYFKEHESQIWNAFKLCSVEEENRSDHTDNIRVDLNKFLSNTVQILFVFVE